MSLDSVGRTTASAWRPRSRRTVLVHNNDVRRRLVAPQSAQTRLVTRSYSGTSTRLLRGPCTPICRCRGSPAGQVTGLANPTRRAELRISDVTRRARPAPDRGAGMIVIRAVTWRRCRDRQKPLFDRYPKSRLKRRSRTVRRRRTRRASHPSPRTRVLHCRAPTEFKTRPKPEKKGAVN